MDTFSEDVQEHPATAIEFVGSARPQVRARLHLQFEERSSVGTDRLDPTHASRAAPAPRTVLKSSLQEPPLKVVRAFDPGDGSALVHLHNVSGGLLGGDQLTLKADLAPGTRVQLTTTGATRIYRPRSTAAPAMQTTQIAVGENGLLEYLPDALIPFARSRYAQQTMIDLSHGAGLFWWEVVAPGREAHGELFEYQQVEIAAHISGEGRPIAIERARLEPALRQPGSLGRLGVYRTWATFYICRVAESPATWRSLEKDLREVAAESSQSGETLCGISPLVAHGLAVRMLTTNGRKLHSALHALWRAAKLRLYGCEPLLPRKVH